MSIALPKASSQESTHLLYNTGATVEGANSAQRGSRSGTSSHFGTARNRLFSLYLIDYSVRAGRRSGDKRQANRKR
jgi:hypothetical protein